MAKRPPNSAETLWNVIASLFDERIAAARAAPPEWGWVSCAALGLTSRAARQLARREGFHPPTRIGGRVFLRRSDLDALASKNLLTGDVLSNADDDVANDVERAFGIAQPPRPSRASRSR